ncbi:hypothetical protein LguiA_032936 [Lonicera macranthoides]
MPTPKLSSSLPSCFRRTTTTNNHPSTAAPPISGNPNLTTSLYKTCFGLFSLTWSHTFLGHSLHINLSLPSLSSPVSYYLHVKPFISWNTKGSRKLKFSNNTTPKIVHFLWDFSRAKFGPGPDPQSGFYIAIVISGELALLLGDSPAEAYSKMKTTQSSVLRTEHVYGNKLYKTRAEFGGKIREITIDCRLGDELTLYFSVDDKRVLEIKHLKWKFRGNERVEIDGVYVQISWDVYNWLFKKGENENGYALFMFIFEKLGFGDEDYLDLTQLSENKNYCGLGCERKKKIKRGSERSSSFSSSLSSISSSNCGSVMEWESMEESKLKGNCGFSLMVYAWKR